MKSSNAQEQRIEWISTQRQEIYKDIQFDSKSKISFWDDIPLFSQYEPEVEENNSFIITQIHLITHNDVPAKLLVGKSSAAYVSGQWFQIDFQVGMRVTVVPCLCCINTESKSTNPNRMHSQNTHKFSENLFQDYLCRNNINSNLCHLNEEPQHRPVTQKFIKTNCSPCNDNCNKENISKEYAYHLNDLKNNTKENIHVNNNCHLNDLKNNTKANARDNTGHLNGLINNPLYDNSTRSNIHGNNNCHLDDSMYIPKYDIDNESNSDNLNDLINNPCIEVYEVNDITNYILIEDDMLTVTSFCTSLECINNSLIKSRVADFSFEYGHHSLVLGNVIHELIQSCLLERTSDGKIIIQETKRIIKERLLQLHVCNISDKELLNEVIGCIHQIKEFLKNGYNIKSIEYPVFSKIFGLKGSIDCLSEYFLFEIKTGEKQRVEHKAQTLLYYLLYLEQLNLKMKRSTLESKSSSDDNRNSVNYGNDDSKIGVNYGNGGCDSKIGVFNVGNCGNDGRKSSSFENRKNGYGNKKCSFENGKDSHDDHKNIGFDGKKDSRGDNKNIGFDENGKINDNEKLGIFEEKNLSNPVPHKKQKVSESNTCNDKPPVKPVIYYVKSQNLVKVDLKHSEIVSLLVIRNRIGTNKEITQCNCPDNAMCAIYNKIKTLDPTHFLRIQLEALEEEIKFTGKSLKAQIVNIKSDKLGSKIILSVKEPLISDGFVSILSKNSKFIARGFVESIEDLKVTVNIRERLDLKGTVYISTEDSSMSYGFMFWSLLNVAYPMYLLRNGLLKLPGYEYGLGVSDNIGKECLKMSNFKNSFSSFEYKSTTTSIDSRNIKNTIVSDGNNNLSSDGNNINNVSNNNDNIKTGNLTNNERNNVSNIITDNSSVSDFSIDNFSSEDLRDSPKSKFENEVFLESNSSISNFSIEENIIILNEEKDISSIGDLSLASTLEKENNNENTTIQEINNFIQNGSAVVNGNIANEIKKNINENNIIANVNTVNENTVNENNKNIQINNINQEIFDQKYDRSNMPSDNQTLAEKNENKNKPKIAFNHIESTDSFQYFTPPVKNIKNNYLFSIPEIFQADYLKLNDEQRSALFHALNCESFKIIHGMPGTGKSTVIALLIKILIFYKKKVLLICYTHMAIDNIINRLGSVRYYRAKREEFNFENSKELKEYLEDIDLVVGSCYSFTDPIFVARKFDYCIIDEGSQVHLLLSLIPISRSLRFCIVGDHLQLKPLAKKGNSLSLSLFEHLIEGCSVLRKQYRMAENIMNLSNRLFYGNKLVGFRSGGIVEFVDSSTVNYEAFIRSLEDCVVLCYFNQQVRDTQLLTDCIVTTIDKFQGSEAEHICIVFDPVKDSVITRSHERLNVALTRAKSKLTLLGNEEEMLAVPIFKSLLELVKK